MLHFFVSWSKEVAKKYNNSKFSLSSVKQEISSGQWNFSLSMMAYTDALRHEAIQANTSMQLDQRVWVEFKAEKVDDQMLSLVTESCWATSQPSPESSLRYDLIKNGCAMETAFLVWLKLPLWIWANSFQEFFCFEQLPEPSWWHRQGRGEWSGTVQLLII